jgi:hypothetical protein
MASKRGAVALWLWLAFAPPLALGGSAVVILLRLAASPHTRYHVGFGERLGLLALVLFGLSAWGALGWRWQRAGPRERLLLVLAGALWAAPATVLLLHGFWQSALAIR